MTRTQITKTLKTGGHDMGTVAEVGRDEVEIFVNDGSGVADERKTKKAICSAQKILGWKGGYYTGYGAFVLQANPIDIGDYNDVSSHWHY